MNRTKEREMKVPEYKRLMKKFNEYSRMRRYAESRQEFDTVYFYDDKMEEIIKIIDNTTRNFDSREIDI
ncbi:MAG TPA: hypothetical protein PKX12_11465 [Spirochaetota bacterium]|nr:hypothetical protein [Spirochaetota bacterium]